ncbi:hypothetical protein HED60_02495 [Planctomycetales bacterium ZRK34]|nr:hypothetical protein HED60_02495 [Planctomycetales bacterium ZRK34]
MRYSMNRLGLGFTLAIVFTFATAALARDVVLTLKDGRQIRGELVSESTGSVTISVAGIETTFPRPMIDDVKVQMSLAEQYQLKRDLLADTNYNGRYDLARWLYDQKSPEAYRLALGELNEILKAKPDHQQAALLRNVVTERLKLEPGNGEATPAPTQPDAGSPTTPMPKPEPEEAEADESKLLTPEQVNLIRVYEVRLDNKPRIAPLPREVVDELYEKYREDPVMQKFLGLRGEQRFRAMTGVEQLRILFQLRARELYEKVQVREDPETLSMFRTKIHPTYVLRYCGRCHMQDKAPGLFLYTKNFNRESVVYTNYMILRRTRLGADPLINKSNPIGSALVQFGLPQKDALTPHPDVPGYKQYFTGPQDRRLQEIADWIGQLYGDTTDYPIDFNPPIVAKPEADKAPAADAPAEKSGAAPAKN